MPNVSGVHIDRALSNVSIYYKNPSYVADVLAPPVQVAKESDKYFIYSRDNFRIPWALRADKSETREIDYAVSLDAYFCEEYGFHELISDRERENSDEALRPDIDATEHITECLLLDREYRVASTILSSTNPDWTPFNLPYNTTHFTNMNTAWDDRVGADPRSDLYYARFVIFRDSRRQPNTVFLPVEVSYRLAQMEQIDELRKYTDPSLVTNSGIPGIIFGLKVYECESTYNAASEGATTSSFTETFGNNVIVAYINPSTLSLKSLTFALTFQKQPFMTRKWREERRKADVIEVSHLYATKIVAAACGFVMTNCITSTIG